MHSGWGTSLEPGRRRVAPETYWAIRRSSTSVRAYLAMHYPGRRDTSTYRDLWLVGEMIDLEVDRAYQAGGLARVTLELQASDTLEHMLARVGAEIAYCCTGDKGMFQELLTSKPPGDSNILPDWAVTAGREQSRALYVQQGRCRNSRGRGADTGDSSDDDGAARRRRRAKAKAKAGEGRPAGRGAKGGGTA